MGKYAEALEEMPISPDVTKTRAYRWKYGLGGNIEQEITRDLGGFVKWGWNDGHSESWAFTPADATLAMGLVLKGRCWCRPNDVFGLGYLMDRLSPIHRDYLAAGGFDFNIGDGRLNYGLEKVLEAFYALQIHKGIFFTLDYQYVVNPAYNGDRGPVSIATGRFHIEF
jgi:high affinity Mn2+ porin